MWPRETEWSIRAAEIANNQDGTNLSNVITQLKENWILNLLSSKLLVIIVAKFTLPCKQTGQLRAMSNMLQLTSIATFKATLATLIYPWQYGVPSEIQISTVIRSAYRQIRIPQIIRGLPLAGRLSWDKNILVDKSRYPGGYHRDLLLFPSSRPFRVPLTPLKHCLRYNPTR